MTQPVAPATTAGASAHWLQQTLQHNSLRYLAWYTGIQLLVMIITTLALESQDLQLPARIGWLLLPAQALLTVITWVASRRRRRVSAALYLSLLLGSIALLDWYLYDAGGHTNPLISLLLVPLAMSAALLGWQATGFVALVVLLSYSTLTQYFMPLGHHHHHGDQFMQLHLVGMWLTFLVSVLLILGLVLPLALSSRAQQKLIAQQQEKMLQDERLIAMATFAASAAHKLGTPLSTLAVLTDDLRTDLADQPALQADLDTMLQQIHVCKSTLHDMMRRADDLRHNVQQPMALPVLVDQLRQQFNLLHPARTLQLDTTLIPDVAVHGDETLVLALLNLLDNAARESRSDPRISLLLENDRICIRIHDDGPGIPDVIRRQLGEPFNTSREDGLGLGLFLSHTTINRLSGTLRLLSSEQGTITEVWLPIHGSVR